jgi:hypothetical protein
MLLNVRSDDAAGCESRSNAVADAYTDKPTIAADLIHGRIVPRHTGRI